MFFFKLACNLQGYHGDTSATFFCGNVDDEARNLVQVAISSLIFAEERKRLMASISLAFFFFAED